MTKLLSSLLLASGLLLTGLPHQAAAQMVPVKQWDKTFGGSDNDDLISIQPTRDGGYIMGGYSNSSLNGDKSQASKGFDDYWLVKVDANGAKQWDRTFGGDGRDYLTSMQPTSDGGYILAGTSETNLSGDKTQASRGGSDFWLIKVDANGNKEWDKTIGGSRPEFLSAVQQTSDGGYILGGLSDSPESGDKTQGSQGLYDYWLVKLDATGAKEWDRTFGGNSFDNLASLQQTSDGGYILGGLSYSPLSGDKSQAGQGYVDYWVVKVDATGTKQWDRSFGGSDYDALTALQQTSDGGYILGGISESPPSGDKTQGSKGGKDYWLVKLDAAGSKQWDKTFGGSTSEFFASLQQTRDGGYILGGTSKSPVNEDKSQASQGVDDYWLVKLDAAGNKQWDKTIGGNDFEYLTSVQQTSDGGYILGGSSRSYPNGDKSQVTKGGDDYWLVKLGSAPLATSSATPMALLTAYPNPTTSTFTLRGPLGTPYQLLNQLGQVVRSGKVSAQPLDVQALPAGLYLLRDQATGRTSKLVKE